MKFLRLFIITTLILGSISAHSQLLERESVQRKIVSGTRPVQGNFGFFIGPSVVELQEIFDDEISVRGFPLMGFKYYLTDNIELRLQSQIYGTKEESQGTLTNNIGLEDNVDKETYYRFMPSAQYHFNSNNFLDTYVGFGFIIGSEVDEILTTQKVNLSGDFVAERFRQQAFVFGYNINFGLQAFVADLPISLGVEAGIRSERKSGLEFEGTSQTSVGGVINEQTFFTKERDADLRFDSLESSESEIGADVRFIISYYFRN